MRASPSQELLSPAKARTPQRPTARRDCNPIRFSHWGPHSGPSPNNPLTTPTAHSFILWSQTLFTYELLSGSKINGKLIFFRLCLPATKADLSVTRCARSSGSHSWLSLMA